MNLQVGFMCQGQGGFLMSQLGEVKAGEEEMVEVKVEAPSADFLH